MSDETNKRDTIIKSSDIVIMALNFFILFNGLRLLLENYLMDDRLPLGYFFLIGLVCAGTTAGINYLTRNKPLKAKILVTVFITILMVGINLI